MSGPGRKMRAALEYVRAHPGCAIAPVARAIGTTEKHGYAIVHRAIKRGMIESTRVVTASGRVRYLLSVPGVS